MLPGEVIVLRVAPAPVTVKVCVSTGASSVPWLVVVQVTGMAVLVRLVPDEGPAQLVPASTTRGVTVISAGAVIPVCAVAVINALGGLGCKAET